jgi:orotate phosphoribosyltransferase
MARSWRGSSFLKTKRKAGSQMMCSQPPSGMSGLQAGLAPMREEEIGDLFASVGAIITNNHFVYASRMHGPNYVAKDEVYAHPIPTNRLCREIARRMHGQGIEALLAPSNGGVILSGLVADHLSRFSGARVDSFFAERDVVQGKPEFKRGYDKRVGSGKRVVAIVGDIGDGVAARELVNAIRRTNSILVGLGALSNSRNLATVDIGVPDLFVPQLSGADGLAGADAFLSRPDLLGPRCQIIANWFSDHVVHTVVGQAPEGALLAQLVARYLMEEKNNGEEVASIYAEHPVVGKFFLKRGFDRLIAGKRVGLLEDVVNTGESITEIIALARQHGATVVRVDALCNRGGVTPETLDVPVFSALMNIKMEAWPAPCPLCLANPPVPINTQYGKGAAYLEERAAAQAGK